MTTGDVVDSRARRDLPSGTVTFVFTDVEGSTRLLHQLGADAYDNALAGHRRVVRAAVARHDGVEVDTQGDSFFLAFPTAAEAVAAAQEILDALADGAIRLRIGIHTGTPRLASEGYVGPDVHKGARIAAAGHGGQVLISAETRALVKVDVTDLGEHRLKDFEAAIPIFQLGDERFPPLKTISNTNLPRPASSFVGREREMTDIHAQLTHGTRLLTLTGAGGTGKTRLALEAAAELVPEFKGGVFWVPLAALRDSSLVMQTIANTLGATDSLDAHIGERQLLVLLDNLEQVVAAAPEIAAVVEACPNLCVMVTSRQRLRVRGEVEYSVPPLAEQDAIELFGERARLEPDDAVRDLCRSLDNLPLAVELAAARTNVLSPPQILERLSRRLDLLKGGRDADPRQQTLRATIEWSHELLDEDERRLFARLSVFRGGSTLDAAEAVAEADLDTLESLVDKSLLRRRDERFWMLETIREYAMERLKSSADYDHIRKRHAEFFVGVAERAYGERFTSAAVSHEMDDERDNVRAALERARDGNPQSYAQVAGAVAYHWSLSGGTREARDHLKSALENYRARDRIRARALTGMATVLGMDRAAFPVLDEAVSICRELGDTLGEALALEAIGYKHIAFGQEDAARQSFERGLALMEQAGATDIERWYSLAGLCQLLIAAGEPSRAEPMANELLKLGTRYGNLDAQGDAFHYLADCALLAGHFVDAETRYLRALRHARDSGLVGQSIEELRGIAMAAAGQGHRSRAVRLAAVASAQREALGIPPLRREHWWGRLQERFVGAAKEALSPTERHQAELAGLEANFDAVVDEVLETADSRAHPAPDTSSAPPGPTTWWSSRSRTTRRG